MESAMEKHKVLALKYRPQNFREVFGQEHIVKIFQNAIEMKKIGHAYLFTGSRGIGKTSIARILAKSLNCDSGPSITPCNTCPTCREIKDCISKDVVEIDGASNTGIDDIRELQKELLYLPSPGKNKIIIIDEVHMLSKNAFNALLKTLEEPPERVIFVFATTEPHKVLPTIISRCQRFDFKRIPVEIIIKRLKEISKAENIKIEDEAMLIIAKKADGGMRDALSLMDQVISYCVNSITVQNVREIFNLINTEVFNTFMQAIYERNPQKIVNAFRKKIDDGIDATEFINNYLEYLRQFLLVKLNIDLPDMLPNEKKIICELVNFFSEDEIVYIINHLIETKNSLRTSSAPELLSEITFVKLAKISDMKSMKAILEKIQSGKEQSIEIPNPRIITYTKETECLISKIEEKNHQNELNIRVESAEANSTTIQTNTENNLNNSEKVSYRLENEVLKREFSNKKSELQQFIDITESVRIK